MFPSCEWNTVHADTPTVARVFLFAFDAVVALSAQGLQIFRIECSDDIDLDRHDVINFCSCRDQPNFLAIFTERI
jgi:hypothetical protein